MGGAVLQAVSRALDAHSFVLDHDLEIGMERSHELALRSCDCHLRSLDSDLDVLWQYDCFQANARHGSPLPDVAEDLTADALTSSLAVGHQASRGADDRNP